MYEHPDTSPADSHKPTCEAQPTLYDARDTEAAEPIPGMSELFDSLATRDPDHASIGMISVDGGG